MKDRYIDFLLKNSHRLKKELSNKKNKETNLANFFPSYQKLQKLKRDIEITIKFYQNIEVVYKEVIILRYLKNMLIKEVANETNFSISHTKTILKRQKEQLKKLLEEAKW